LGLLATPTCPTFFSPKISKPRKQKWENGVSQTRPTNQILDILLVVGKKITAFEILFGAFTVGCDNGAQILSLEI